MNESIEVDQVSRSILAIVENGSFSGIEAAEDFIAGFQPTIIVGQASLSSYAAQAALITAATCSVRAFHGAHIRLATTSANLWRGSSAASLSTVLQEVGADFLPMEKAAVALLIGDAVLQPSDAFDHVLRVTWEGWTASVVPGPDAERLTEDEGVVMAALAAAGLAVNEIFELAKGRGVATQRRVQLDLWNLEAEGPREMRAIAEVPAEWWLVGLGHLGQANAWLLSWLPQPRNRPATVVLQDDETIVKANLSTSLCASAADIGERKSRVVARVLDRAGYTTRILERRLENNFVDSGPERPVALFGVDNLDARRASGHHGWPLVIDVGLGSGANDFGAISLHTFPGDVASDEIASWRVDTAFEERRRELRLAKSGFQSLLANHDICGVEVLAGTNVAASFVGVVAACMAVAEAIKAVHGGPQVRSAGVELWDVDPTRQATTVRRSVNSLRSAPTMPAQ